MKKQISFLILELILIVLTYHMFIRSFNLMQLFEYQSDDHMVAPVAVFLYGTLLIRIFVDIILDIISIFKSSKNNDDKNK